MRRFLVWAAVAVLLATGEWLASRPPAWLALDPLERPFGLAPLDSLSAPAETDAESPPVSFPVAVNRAGPRELQALPGVGPVLAGRIVAARAADGPFAGPDDLDAVPGIGPRTLERLLPLVSFAAPADTAP